VINSDGFDVSRAALPDWVTPSANAVTAYFGQFPVAHARVNKSCGALTCFKRRQLQAMMGRIAEFLWAGKQDQTIYTKIGNLPHENGSLSDFHRVDRHHHLIEEGVAALARASIGTLTAEQAWGICAGIYCRVCGGGRPGAGPYPHVGPNILGRLRATRCFG
jgi:hypothetical protein